MSKLTVEQVEHFRKQVTVIDVDGLNLSDSVKDAYREDNRIVNAVCDLARAALDAEPVALSFDRFRIANVARCVKWHPAGVESWSPSDWLTAVTGELGELASLLKMRNRERDGLVGNKFSPTDKQVADELADVLTYLDLLAHVLGVDLGKAAAEKFNEVSARNGFTDRIDLARASLDAEPVADGMRKALRYYANGHHFGLADKDAWDTVSGEPQNLWCDDAGTATVEDGTIAKLALRGEPIEWMGDGEDCTPKPIDGEVASPPAAPGCVSVPLEPTEAMVKAGGQVLYLQFSHEHSGMRELTARCYKAMLSAREVK